ncbi:sugar phosphate isomerase/epimerase [Fervidobacterium riparium]|uniref:sugar phosphate isomerase/epimerase family protein n=1 Tax=Fervidobacterium gondwanense TaxID=44754 RepID=UPI0021FB6E86|nr:sugar phosphate isomerase [Fervidobacterium riparium]
MKVGFLTVALGEMRFEKMVQWAHENLFEALEVAVWPLINERDFSSTTIDVEKLDKKGVEEIKSVLDKYGIIISSLAYYDNNLDANEEKRAKINQHLVRVIDAANLLGVELVGTFIGRDIRKSVEENIIEFEKVFKPSIAYAESKNVRLMIENCPMIGWQQPEKIGNIFYSPELWREIFRITPDSFGLNFDPSHLYWLGIDYLKVIGEFGRRIFHVHAKDVDIDETLVLEQSILGHFGTNLHGQSWWTYRVPGLGKISWGDFVRELRKIGYDYVISIELEDPVWFGPMEKSEKGLRLGLNHLRKFL